MADPTHWKDALLNDDGEDLIYEVEGDAERGNPLDIVSPIGCTTVETVTGLMFPAKAVALEVKKRWNSHNELVATLLRCREYVERAASRWEDDAAGSLAALDAALKNAGVD